jgi:hypothetical protein
MVSKFHLPFAMAAKCLDASRTIESKYVEYDLCETCVVANRPSVFVDIQRLSNSRCGVLVYGLNVVTNQELSK